MITKNNIIRILKELALNISVPTTIGVIFGLSGNELIIIVLSSLLIDADHLITYFAENDDYSIKSITASLANSYDHKISRLYPAHTIEFLIFVFSLGIILESRTILIILSGFVLNIVVDLYVYLFRYEGPKTWLAYLSAINYYVNKPGN